MKNRQFITLLLLIVTWFIYLWSRIDTLEKYAKNIDQNVVTIDERIVWDIVPKVETLYDKSYWL